MLLALSARVQAYQNISSFSGYVASTSIAACSTSKMDSPVLYQSSLQRGSVKQNSNLLNLNKKNYRKKTILLYQTQDNKNKNVLYNLSAKPTFGEIISNKNNKNFFLEATK